MASIKDIKLGDIYYMQTPKKGLLSYVVFEKGRKYVHISCVETYSSAVCTVLESGILKEVTKYSPEYFYTMEKLKAIEKAKELESLLRATLERNLNLFNETFEDDVQDAIVNLREALDILL